MEKMVLELRQLVNFKDTTNVGDLVLIASLDPDMLIYALVSSIERDTSRRDAWWHVTMHLLAVPPRQTVWTLRRAQFTGREIFTMDGAKRFVQAVHFESDGPRPMNAAKKTHVKHETTGSRKFRIIKSNKINS